MAGVAQRLTDALGALVLPGQDRGQRVAASPIPDDAGFALGAEPDRNDALRRLCVERLPDRPPHARPDLVGVLIDPASLRRRQRDRRLPAADHLTAIVDHEALGRAGALID